MNKINNAKNIQIIYSKIARKLNNFDLEISGLENIPDTPCIFVCNHSNSHDFYTIQEVFAKLNREVSVLVGSDCLNLPSKILFELGSSIMVDRTSPVDRKNSKEMMILKLKNKSDVFVFGEGTWNLHPYKLMLPISKGSVQVGYETETYIVPTVFEYIENKNILSSENNLFKKCIIKFGKPIKIKYPDNIIAKTSQIENDLIKARTDIKQSNNCLYSNLEDINIDMYLNHTYLKKNTPLFKYNSDYESQFIRRLNGLEQDNEFVVNTNGEFVPRRILKR